MSVATPTSRSIVQSGKKRYAIRVNSAISGMARAYLKYIAPVN